MPVRFPPAPFRLRPFAALGLAAAFAVTGACSRAAVPTAAPSPTPAAAAAPRVRHVFIISIDGGKPSVMRDTAMPTVEGFARDGAVTWNARTVFPSVTLVSHTSMLTGLTPLHHQVLWNDWKPERGMVPVPTVLALTEKHDKNLVTAMVVAKPKLIHLFAPGGVDEFSLPGYDAESVATVAVRLIERRKPNLCFIHFADADGAGHAHGWGSDEQKKALRDIDAALGRVRDAITRAGIADRSVILVTADHGGHKKTHGTDSLEDLRIPWIVWGAGVRGGHTIRHPVSTVDTAATALWLLGVPHPDNLDGRPVAGAFVDGDAGTAGGAPPERGDRPGVPDRRLR
jgi:predicted AlkP superfamily pyrophosphatase or phosphodiesterase